MAKFCFNVTCLTHVGYKKRMFLYLLLFIYYIVQLVLYQKGVHNHTFHDALVNQQYLVAVDVLLLIQALIALACGWALRSVFETGAVFFNAILFGLTFAWLILAGPNISQHRAYFGINASVVIFLMIVDVSALLYVRPEVISVGPHSPSTATAMPGRKSSISRVVSSSPGSLVASYGKIRNRFLSGEDSSSSTNGGNGGGPMADKADIESLVPEDNLSDTSPLPLSSQLENEVIVGNIKVDLSASGVCEGFRVNLGAVTMPPSTIEQVPLALPPRDLTWDAFTHVQHIVDSSSCHIYTALWEQRPVVLKLIKAERLSSAVAVAEFEAEENVLSRTRHPHIVRFFGSGKNPRKFLVLELLSGGSLSHSLGLRADSQNQTWVKRFSFLETLHLALALAKALQYLHHDWSSSVHILHRDIKPDNIGFAADGKLKLFDFGLCVAVRAQREKTEQYRLTGNTGTLRYMAPEVVLGRSYHQSVDAYSFGILVWQVATGKVPFKDMGKKTYFDRVVVGGQRLRMDPRWPSAFQQLLRLCWHEEKNTRPSFTYVVHELETLIKNEEMMITARQNRIHRRCLTTLAMFICRGRPLLLLALVVIFILALLAAAQGNETVLGALLGGLSSFGLYSIFMSYLRIWPGWGALIGGNGGVSLPSLPKRRRQFRSSSLDVPDVHNIQGNSIGGDGDEDQGVLQEQERREVEMIGGGASSFSDSQDEEDDNNTTRNNTTRLANATTAFNPLSLGISSRTPHRGASNGHSGGGGGGGGSGGVSGSFTSSSVIV